MVSEHEGRRTAYGKYLEWATEEIIFTYEV
jgi:hypothetical protein